MINAPLRELAFGAPPRGLARQRPLSHWSHSPQPQQEVYLSEPPAKRGKCAAKRPRSGSVRLWLCAASSTITPRSLKPSFCQRQSPLQSNCRRSWGKTRAEGSEVEVMAVARGRHVQCCRCAQPSVLPGLVGLLQAVSGGALLPQVPSDATKGPRAQQRGHPLHR